MGIIIDEVREVLDIKADSIEETPSFGSSINTDFILGMGKMNGNVQNSARYRQSVICAGVK
jgi:purine-binding chemotaxis protein CheW